MNKQLIWYFSLLAVLTFISYFPILSHSFTYFDDHVQIVENPYVLHFDFHSLKAIFSNSFVGMYQPITTTIYAFITTLFGINGPAFHLTSIVFHLLNSYLLFKVLSKFLTSRKVLYLLTAIFALHPLNVESVAWASAFSTLVFTFFILLGFLYYIKFCEHRKYKYYFLTLLFFVLGCLSKSAAVIFPLLLITYDYYKQQRLTINYWNKIPFLLLSLIFGIITLYSRTSSGHLADLSPAFSFVDRIFLVSHSILFYPLKFILPIHLSAFYPYPTLIDGLLPITYYLSLPILILIAALIVYFKRHKLIWFAIAWYLCSISLVIQLIPVGNQITTDRYSYLPLLGMLLILGYVLTKIKSTVLHYTLLVLTIILGIQTHQRSKIWKNDQLLWKSVLKIYPNVAQAYNNLGSYALKQNEVQKAFNHFNKAIQLQNNYADAYSNRGNIYAQRNEKQKAIADYNKAILLEPHADAYFNRANEYVKIGKLQAAVNDYTESLKLQVSPDVYTYRANALFMQKKLSAALSDLDKAILLDPRFHSAYLLKAMIEYQSGNHALACFNIKKAADLGNSTAKNGIASICR